MKFYSRYTRALEGHFLEFIRDVGEAAGCLICANNLTIDPAHLRYSDAAAGKVNPGFGAKSENAVPLCRRCHDAQHRGGEPKFWQGGPDPLRVSDRLFALFMRGDFDAACEFIKKIRTGEGVTKDR